MKSLADWEPLLQLMLPITGLFLVVFVLGWLGLFGPLFGFDLLRITRKGQQVKLRCLFAVMLLLALFFTYLDWFPNADLVAVLTGAEVYLPIDDMARFAEQFVWLFLMIQIAAVLFITPAYAAGAISEEKERRTLEYLFATQLTNREIVLGKFMSRMVHVGGILLTGLPILTLTQLWGGVEIRVVLFGYAIALLAMWSTAGIAIACAVANNDLRSALSRTYILLLVFEMFGWCFSACVSVQGVSSSLGAITFLFHPNTDHPLSFAIYAAVHGLIGLGCVIWAIVMVRGGQSVPLHRRHALPSPSVPLLISSFDEETDAPIPAWFLLNRPRVDADEPLVWKERYVTGLPISPPFSEQMKGFGAFVVAMMVFFLLLLGCCILGTLLDGGPISNLMFHLVRWIGGLTILVWVIVMGLHAVATVTRERERDTLLSLLTLPIEREQMLWAKARGTWWRGRRLRWFLIGMGFAGVATGGLHPLSLVLVIPFMLSLGALVIAWGMWLSVKCRTVMSATGWFLVSLLGLLFGPMALGSLARALGYSESGQVVESFSPPIAWDQATFSLPQGLVSESWTALIIVEYVAVAVVLWVLTTRRFEDEGKF